MSKTKTAKTTATRKTAKKATPSKAKASKTGKAKTTARKRKATKATPKPETTAPEQPKTEDKPRPRNAPIPGHTETVFGQKIAIDGKRTSKPGALPYFRATFCELAATPEANAEGIARSALREDFASTFGAKAVFALSNYVAKAKRGELRDCPAIVEEGGILRAVVA